jgi:hypothetical protein
MAAATEEASAELARPAARSTARLVCDIIPAWTLNFFARLVEFH